MGGVCSHSPSVRRRETWAVNLGGAWNRFPKNLPIRVWLDPGGSVDKASQISHIFPGRAELRRGLLSGGGS